MKKTTMALIGIAIAVSALKLIKLNVKIDVYAKPYSELDDRLKEIENAGPEDLISWEDLKKELGWETSEVPTNEQAKPVFGLLKALDESNYTLDDWYAGLATPDVDEMVKEWDNIRHNLEKEDK